MCRNATVVYVHMQQAWCKCWAVAWPPVVPGGFCFTMSQLVEDSIAHMEDSLNTGRCILSEGLLVDPVGWAPGYGKEGFESYVIKTHKCHLRIQKGELWSELEKLLWPWCIFCFCLCTNEHLRTLHTIFHIWKEQVHACRLAAFVPHAKTFSFSICELHLLNICTAA